MKKRKKVRKAVRKRKEKTFKKLRKRVVFIVIDGLADLPLNGRTPLSTARKPNLDFLAKNGIVGEIIPLEIKHFSKLSHASISHTANLGLLGFDAKKYNLKRGPLEAVGSNIPYNNGWLAVRCDFSTVDNQLKVLDRRVGRNSTGLDEIARYINEHVHISVPHIFMRTYEHRAVLILKENLSDRISDSDPYENWKSVRRIEALTPEAKRSAELVQEFIDKARQVIEFHPANGQRIKNGLPPANYILTREAGNNLLAIPCFTKKHKIKKAVCIAENGVMKATCMLAGFDGISVPELRLEQTLNFIFSNVFNSLAEYDFVYAHIKAPDEPAHDGDFHGKQVAIEKIDEYLEDFKNFNGILILTCDHITSCKTRKHEPGPVPILIYGKGKDKVDRFDEFSVKKGRLKLINGKKLWKFVFGR
jgi:2,3-bisphosphoglycerate-independent phosphoglycerate mutase